MNSHNTSNDADTRSHSCHSSHSGRSSRTSKSRKNSGKNKSNKTHKKGIRSKSTHKHLATEFEDKKAERHREHILKQLTENYVCGICSDTLWHPASLLCGHSFCIHCLARYLSYYDIGMQRCPTCRASIEGPTIRQNRLLIELLTKHYKPHYQDICNKMKTDEVLREIYVVTPRADELMAEIQSELEVYGLMSISGLTTSLIQSTVFPDLHKTEIYFLVERGRSLGKWSTIYDLVLRKSIGEVSPRPRSKIDWSLLDKHAKCTFPIASTKELRNAILQQIERMEIDLPAIAGRNAPGDSETYSYEDTPEDSETYSYEGASEGSGSGSAGSESEPSFRSPELSDQVDHPLDETQLNGDDEADSDSYWDYIQNRIDWLAADANNMSCRTSQ